MTDVIPDEAVLFAPPAHDSRLVRRWAWIVTGVLLAAYLALQNRYWVPGGDSDFYVAIARSMAHGLGFRYNGLSVAICPPGWPWVMAELMKITPEFLVLKLTAMLGMLLSLVVSYFIALRFARPATAGIATILCGLLMPVYSLTYFLHSEGLYCLASTLALLMALRIREGHGKWPTRIALLLLCVAIPLVRWAGVFQLLPIVAVLLAGRWGVAWRNRHWKMALACFLVITGTWIVTRQALSLTKAEQEAIKDAGGGSETESDADDVPAEAANVAIAPISKEDNHGIVAEYAQRFLRSGKWFAWLLWQPTRFASVNRYADLLITLLGWIVILMLAALVVVAARRGEWLWLSLALYCGGLCMNWPNPNARYFVPVAPLIVLGLFVIIQIARDANPPVAFDGWKWTRRALIYSILLCNLAMYGVDVIVMRSNHFYDTFEAGQHKDLVNVAHYLMSLPPRPNPDAPFNPLKPWQPEDGKVVVNERYENLNRVRYSNASSRAMVLLTDLNIKPLGHGGLTKQINPPFIPRLGKEMTRLSAEWLLVQSPAVPWRVWHFRLPMSLYKKLSKQPDARESGGWTLYAYDRQTKTFTQTPVPSVDDWPTRVPGM